jgi:hypothetical protein
MSPHDKHVSNAMAIVVTPFSPGSRHNVPVSRNLRIAGSSPPQEPRPKLSSGRNARLWPTNPISAKRLLIRKPYMLPSAPSNVPGVSHIVPWARDRKDYCSSSLILLFEDFDAWAKDSPCCCSHESWRRAWSSSLVLERPPLKPRRTGAGQLGPTNQGGWLGWPSVAVLLRNSADELQSLVRRLSWICVAHRTQRRIRRRQTLAPTVPSHSPGALSSAVDPSFVWTDAGVCSD